MKLFQNDLPTYFASVSTAVATRDLTSSIAGGTDYNQRVGRSVHVKEIQFNGQLVGGQANTVTDENRNVVRISIVGCNSGLVWNAGTYNPSMVLDPRIMAGLHHVYYDEVISLVSPGADGTGYLPATTMVSRKIKVNKVLNWPSAAGAATTPYCIFMVMSTDSAAVPHPGFVSGTAVVSFTDM